MTWLMKQFETTWLEKIFLTAAFFWVELMLKVPEGTNPGEDPLFMGTMGVVWITSSLALIMRIEKYQKGL